MSNSKAATASKEALNLCKSHVNLLRIGVGVGNAELEQREASEYCKQNCHFQGETETKRKRDRDREEVI